MLNEHPWRKIPLPERLRSAPSLLSEDERSYLYWLARDWYRGRGEIVDLGAFLGSSTAALALGLADRRFWYRRPPAKIKSYDFFRVLAEFQLPEHLACRPEFAKLRDRKAGDSFLDVYLETLGDLAKFVEPREGDITQARWDGGDIAVLHVDIMKSWETTDHVIREFFAPLRPGAMVVHQDIKLQYCDWIILSMGELRDYLAPVHNQWGNMISFQVTQQIPPRVLNQGFDRRLQDAPDAETHFDWLLAYLDHPSDRALVDGARLFWMLERKQIDAALAFFDWCAKRYPDSCVHYFIATVFTHRADWNALLDAQRLRVIERAAAAVLQP